VNWGARVSAAFAMDQEVWARHANPLSFWTRVAAFPLLILAIWSRAWLGGFSILPIAVMLGWLWYNPRAFPPPASTNNWASKAVLGERVWIARNGTPIPRHHADAALLLAAVAASGVPFLVWGLYSFAVWPMLLGFALVFFGKLWFADRMVWLYEDMKDVKPEYRSWLY
jgi:hypothetical protein